MILKTPPMPANHQSAHTVRAFLALLSVLTAAGMRVVLVMDDHHCPAVLVENLPGGMSSGMCFQDSQRHGQRWCDDVNRMLGLTPLDVTRIIQTTRRDWVHMGG